MTKFLRIIPLLLLALAPLNPCLANGDFLVNDPEGNEISVRTAPAPGETLVIWFLDHVEERPQFEGMLKAVQESGMEVWRVDLLADYFLPRSNENIRTLPGDGIAAVIHAAHQRSEKRILLATYDRMPVPLLRGIRRWQELHPDDSRLLGAALYYPNLFGPAPLAGEDPVVDPIVGATNMPVVIYQPEEGSHRLRINEVMEKFWANEAPAYLHLVPDVRDWFFMHPPGENPNEKLATGKVPGQLHQVARLLGRHQKPASPLPLPGQSGGSAAITGLIPFRRPTATPAFELGGLDGSSFGSSALAGKVTLINFWATWCPPCVEEIPSLNQLAGRYRDKAFEIVSIDYRETVPSVLEFSKKIPVEFPVLMDLDGQVSYAWKVFSFPSSFLLDRKGNIRYSVNRAIDWNTPEVWKTIDTLLTE
jgi:thiol-disulfide isomerase/thioredoxin